MKFPRSLAAYVSSADYARQKGRARLKIIQGLVMILFTLVIIRLADIMLIRPGDEDVPSPAPQQQASRADIIDREGVLLATTLQSISLYADPTLIEDKAIIAQHLNRILGIKNAADRLDKSGRFVWIKRDITPDQQAAVNALGSPGLDFKTESKRFYPHGALAAHLVGYTSVDGQGLAGLEQYYHDALTVKNAAPIQTSMDIRLQYTLHKNLQRAQHVYKAKAAMGGIIDVTTGEILAAVSLPDFDPNHIAKASGNQRFNRFAHGVYEMGSTFKLFSTANFLEETGKPFSTQFDARKPLEEGRFTINDFHAEKRILTVPEVFVHSSNIGSALMGRATGTEAMQKFYADLGLTAPLKADFPALPEPLSPSPWRDINTLTAAFGHGIAVSPLHVLQATGAIVNNGLFSPLSFVKKDQEDDIMLRVLSPQTSKKMLQLLRLNVTHGSGQQADIHGFSVGGKTGTSEKVGADGYDKHKLLSSFIGVFPVHEPRYAVLAILDEPQGTRESFGYATGGWVAAPAVGDIIADIAQITGLPADDKAPNLTAGLEQYLQHKPQFTKADFRQ